MKFIIFLLAQLFLFTLASPVEDTAELEIEVYNIRNDKGQIALTLFAEKKGFPMQPELADRQVKIPAEVGSVIVKLKDLPYGTYAVAVMHDENLNDRVDLNFLGIPKEGTGSSNDARNLFSGPDFEQAVFNFSPVAEKIKIRMFY